MWYEDKNGEIDYGKPIYCTAVSGDNLLLVPQLSSDQSKAEDNYQIIGYNWLNLNTGRYNSACFFETARIAVHSYRSCNPVNCKIVCAEE